MNVFSYKKFEDLTISDAELLKQAYDRMKSEGYEPGFDFGDFIDIVVGRGDHKFNEFIEQEQWEKENDKNDRK